MWAWLVLVGATLDTRLYPSTRRSSCTAVQTQAKHFKPHGILENYPPPHPLPPRSVRYTFSLHSNEHAFFQPTVLASVPREPVDDAVAGPSAGVAGVRPDAPPEEALASLAAQHPEVVAGGCVPAHLATEPHGAGPLCRSGLQLGRNRCTGGHWFHCIHFLQQTSGVSSGCCVTRLEAGIVPVLLQRALEVAAVFNVSGVVVWTARIVRYSSGSEGGCVAISEHRGTSVPQVHFSDIAGCSIVSRRRVRCTRHVRLCTEKRIVAHLTEPLPKMRKLK